MSYYRNWKKETNGRGWSWNRIFERLPVPRHKALFLVLAGEDGERQKLIGQRGIKNHQIISVDRDRKAVKLVRANGGIAIHADVGDVLEWWPGHTQLHALSLDFNCGFDCSILPVMRALICSPGVALGAAIYCNLMRGRDGLGEAMTQAQAGAVGFRQDRRGNSITTQPAPGRLNVLNRAECMAYGLAKMSAEIVPGVDRDKLLKVMRVELARPYRAHIVTMDGVVFRKALYGQVREMVPAPGFEPWARKIRAKIAAALAVRTKLMRQVA